MKKVKKIKLIKFDKIQEIDNNTKEAEGEEVKKISLDKKNNEEEVSNNTEVKRIIVNETPNSENNLNTVLSKLMNNDENIKRIVVNTETEKPKRKYNRKKQ